MEERFLSASSGAETDPSSAVAPDRGQARERPLRAEVAYLYTGDTAVSDKGEIPVWQPPPRREAGDQQVK